MHPRYLDAVEISPLPPPSLWLDPSTSLVAWTKAYLSGSARRTLKSLCA